MHIIITGDVQSGKSTLAANLVSFLKAGKISLAGILATGLWKNDLRQGFDLVDLKTGIVTPLARRRTDPENSGLTPFEFFPKGMAAGEKALDVNTCQHARVIMVDEVGKLELKGQGWAGFLDPLLTLKAATHIWIVRESLVKEVAKKWNLAGIEIVYANHERALERLKSLCITPHALTGTTKIETVGADSISAQTDSISAQTDSISAQTDSISAQTDSISANRAEIDSAPTTVLYNKES